MSEQPCERHRAAARDILSDVSNVRYGTGIPLEELIVASLERHYPATPAQSDRELAAEIIAAVIANREAETGRTVDSIAAILSQRGDVERLRHALEKRVWLRSDGETVSMNFSNGDDAYACLSATAIKPIDELSTRSLWAAKRITKLFGNFNAFTVAQVATILDEEYPPLKQENSNGQLVSFAHSHGDKSS